MRRCNLLILSAYLILDSGISFCAAGDKLSAMSLEELLTRNAANPPRIERAALHGALRSKLEALPTNRLIDLQWESAAPDERSSGSYVSYPLLDLVEGADLIVQGKVEKIEHSHEDLISNIVNRELDLIRMSVDLKVLR